MTYNPFVPLAADYFDGSQVDFLTDFQELAELWEIDHGALDDGTVSTRGKHEAVHLSVDEELPETVDDVGTVFSRTQIINDVEFANLCYRYPTGDIHCFFDGGKPSNNGLVLRFACVVDLTNGDLINPVNISSAGVTPLSFYPKTVLVRFEEDEPDQNFFFKIVPILNGGSYNAGGSVTGPYAITWQQDHIEFRIQESYRKVSIIGWRIYAS